MLAGGGRTALGCAAAELLSINAQGIAAGYSTVNVGTLLSPVFEPRPFLVNFAGASITPLMTFTSPAERGIARSVSASGDACGTAQDLSDQGREYPVAWVDGAIVRLASLPFCSSKVATAPARARASLSARLQSASASRWRRGKRQA